MPLCYAEVVNGVHIDISIGREASGTTAYIEGHDKELISALRQSARNYWDQYPERRGANPWCWVELSPPDEKIRYMAWVHRSDDWLLTLPSYSSPRNGRLVIGMWDLGRQED